MKKGHIWHRGSLQMLVSTEEQQPSWALAQIFFGWFSGPRDVLRVVLRFVMGSETWAGERMECDFSLDPSLSAWFDAMKQRIFVGFASIFIVFVGIGLYTLWFVSRVGGLSM